MKMPRSSMYAHDDSLPSSLALMNSTAEIDQDSERRVCQEIVGRRRTAAAVKQWIISDQGTQHRVQASEARNEDDRSSQELRVSCWCVNVPLESCSLRVRAFRGDRSAAEFFHELPDETQYADYYQLIQQPISLAEINVSIHRLSKGPPS